MDIIDKMMDVFVPIIALGFIFLMFFLICGIGCKGNHEGTVYRRKSRLGAKVTTQPRTQHQTKPRIQHGIQHTSSQVSLPYPVDDRHPVPQAVQITRPPGPGFTTHTAPYPTHVPYLLPQPVGPNVTVTTQHVSSVVSPPYPVDERHPIPQTVQTTGPPAPGFATHTAPYPTHVPYPQPVAPFYPPPIGISPYPPTIGSTPYSQPAGGTPYPPVGPTPYPPGPGSYNAHPPPYDVAVSTPPVQPPRDREAYVKQAPYNPNYS